MRKQLDFDKKQFTKEKRRINAVLLIVSFVVSVISCLIIYKTAYSGAYVPKNYLLNIELPFPIMVLIGMAAGTLLLFEALKILFSKHFIIKKMGDEFADVISQKIEKTFFDVYKEKESKPVGVLILVFGIAAIIFFSLNNVGFYNDYCKFSDSHNLIVQKVEYSKLTLYKVDGWYEDGKTFLYNADAYAIISDDGKSYDFGIVSNEFEKELFLRFGSDYVEAESVDSVLAQRN